MTIKLFYPFHTRLVQGYTRPFRLLLNWKNLNFSDNVNHVNSLKINVRQIALQCIHGKKIALTSPQLWLKVSSHTIIDDVNDLLNDNREELQKWNCKEKSFRCWPSHPLLPWATVLSRQDTPCRRTSLERSRSTTPAISSKLSRRFPLKTTHLPFAVSCFWPCGLHMSEPGSSTANTSIFGRLALSLRNLPGPHHDFRGDLCHRLHPRYLLPLHSFKIPKLSVLTVHEAKSIRVFLSDFWWLDRFPFEERQKVRHSVQPSLLSPRSMSNSQKFNIIHMAGYEFVASKWILWRVKFSMNECIQRPPTVFTKFMKFNNKRKALQLRRHCQKWPASPIGKNGDRPHSQIECAVLWVSGSNGNSVWLKRTTWSCIF